MLYLISPLIFFLFAVVHVFDLPTGLVVRSSTDNAVTKISHKMTVATIALSQTGATNERKLAVLDFNKDLYVVSVKDAKQKFIRLGIFFMTCNILYVAFCRDQFREKKSLTNTALFFVVSYLQMLQLASFFTITIR